MNRDSLDAGRLIAVVGPSGVGKDSVIDGMLAADTRLRRVRRVVTREAGLPGEDHIPMDAEAFGEAVSAGAFCLHWHAHGLSYGIPLHVLRDVAAGEHCVVNLSRDAVRDAVARFPAVIALHVTARPETIAARLAQRGRESLDQIRHRLARSNRPLPDSVDVVHIANDGSLDDAVAAALRALQPVSA
ncbi:MAG: phosphonate metabolism protein/1,5-bisphosphokinase (PRPP-forming) PhnN [Pseudomonadota bacterium]